MDFVEKVLKFNEIAGTLPEFNPRKVALYTGLQLEEMAEKIAAYNEPGLGKLQVALEYHSRRFKAGEFDAAAEKIDRKEALDADIDIAVVALGGAVSVGSDVPGVTHHVSDNNLSKFPLVDGEYTVLKDENGKVMKPPGYSPADVGPYLL